MSRVLHCLASMRVGGVEKRVLDAVLKLVTKGSRHQHIICAFGDGPLREQYEPLLSDAGVPFHFLRRASRYSRAFREALRETAEAANPDILHAYNETAGRWVRLLLGRDHRWKIIMHCGGGGALPWQWQLLESLLKRWTDEFVFNSHANSHVWCNDVRIRDHFRVIHNGVDVENLLAEPLQSPPMSPFRLLTVCRAVAIKNLSARIRVLRLLHDRGATDVHLTVVGDGPYLAGMKQQAHEAGLSDAVSFEGYQTQPKRYHNNAHAFLCTSYNETFNMSLAEAMLSRLVCIAPSVGGPSEIIRDGESGFLVDCTEPLPTSLKGSLPAGQTIPKRVYDYRTSTLRQPLGIDIEQLADCIELVRDCYDQMTAIREAARRRIVEDFSMDRYCRDLEALYDELSG